MPWNQTTFPDRMAPAFAGMPANTRPADDISRLVADAGGIGFGLPTWQGAASNQITATFSVTIANFVGVTIRDVTLARTAADAAFLDKFKQGDGAAVRREGVIWVASAVTVTAGQLAYITPAGGFTNVSNGGANCGPIGRWDSSNAAPGLARLELHKKSQ
jgi:hypothetical protein